MKTSIIVNMAWNGFFILMVVSEMLGLTELSWWWIVALAGGNLVIHVIQLVFLSCKPCVKVKS